MITAFALAIPVMTLPASAGQVEPTTIPGVEPVEDRLRVLEAELRTATTAHAAARIRAVPKVTMDPLLDFEPAADTNHGNCSSANLGVGFKGINMSVSATQCDKSDIRYWPKEPGKFENVWRGRAWRKERHVEYLLLASSPTKTSGNSLWTVSKALWAELKTGPIPS